MWTQAGQMSEGDQESQEAFFRGLLEQQRQAEFLPSPGKRTRTASSSEDAAPELRPTSERATRGAVQMAGDPDTPGARPSPSITHELVINTVVLEPGRDRVAADISQANQIYNRHGLRIRRGQTLRISADQTRALLSSGQAGERGQDRDETRAQSGDQDRRLDEGSPPSLGGPFGETPTHRPAQASGEVLELLSRNRTEGVPTAYWLPAASLSNDDRDGFTYDSSFFGNLGGNEGIVVTADAGADTFAHELGHLCLRAGHEDLEGNEGTAVAPENLMYPHPTVVDEESPHVGESRGQALNQAQIRRILSSRYVRPLLGASAARAASPAGGGPQRAAVDGRAAPDARAATLAAARGVQSAAAPLPHVETIQRAFGDHDLSGVRTQTGGEAADVCDYLHARAYVVDGSVAFRGAPDLHTAAHEAAHVVQQRHGVQLRDGMGQPGDQYEQHADAVADLVVRGESAEPVLDAMTGGRAAHEPAMQRLEHPAVQFDGGPTATPADADTDEFSEVFNREFAAQLHIFGTDGQAAAERGPDVSSAQVGHASGAPVPASRLRQLFTSGQREKLSSFIATRVIPSRLFDGDDVGGASAQQRILLSGHILATGVYEPGSFAQRMHARMCGHWANLVMTYAGAGDGGGRGIREQFDHEGNLALGTGQREGQTGERIRDDEYGEGDARPVRSQFQMRGLSMDEIDTLQAGDWIWYFNDNGGGGGNHSVIFSRFAGPRETATDPATGQSGPFRRAVCMSQRNPTEGGVEHTARLGERYLPIDGGRVTPVTHVSRVSADAHPVRTGEDLRQVLGTGGDAASNQRFIDRLMRRHPGQRMNWDALADDLRARNRALLERLTAAHSARMTQGQTDAITQLNAAALHENGENADITTLCRLNDRLQAWIANADTLAEGEEAQRSRVETRRTETAEDNGPERELVEQEIEELDREIAGYEEIQNAALERFRELDQAGELRDAIRRQAALRAQRRANRDEWRATRDREARTEIDRRLVPIETELAPVHATCERLTAEQAANRSELRQLRQAANRQNAPIARANRRRQAALEHLNRLEGQSGRYTVHSGDRNAFQGRGETREGRSGLLENLRPQPNWSAMLVPAESGGE